VALVATLRHGGSSCAQPVSSTAAHQQQHRQEPLLQDELHGEGSIGVFGVFLPLFFSR
jgi:hypothetical protein